MVEDVQPPEPPAWLLDVSRQVVPGWLHRITTDAVRRADIAIATTGSPVDGSMDEMIARTNADLLDALADLLSTDVDEQRSTPLTLFRDAVRAPTAWLREHDVPARPASTGGSFPDDIYGLGPATWSDIDPDLHEPGLTWGAWKAMTVLARRRDDGMR